MIRIVLAEDDQDDRQFFEEGLQGLHAVQCHFTGVQNGKDLIEHLLDGVLPDVIVLDLNMPLMDGFAALEWLKKQEHFHDIPVFVLTTSNKNSDKEKCERLGAIGFFTKPTSLRGYQHIAEQILSNL